MSFINDAYRSIIMYEPITRDCTTVIKYETNKWLTVDKDRQGKVRKQFLNDMELSELIERNKILDYQVYCR